MDFASGFRIRLLNPLGECLRLQWTDLLLDAIGQLALGLGKARWVPALRRSKAGLGRTLKDSGPFPAFLRVLIFQQITLLED